MDTFHNPDRYMSDLRQILAQGRKRIGLLVGAGAPLAIRVNNQGELDSRGSPLIPGVEELTRIAVDSLEERHKTAARAILVDLGASANIETLLSKIRLLEQALGNTVVHGLDSAGYKDLGRSICEKIGDVVGVELPKQSNSYTELIGWISGTFRSNAVEIFSTNYDLLFEEAFERSKAPYFDGFSGGNVPFFDSATVAGDILPSRWSRLWKLHGSIGWGIHNGTVVRTGGRKSTQLVYPDHLKYDLTQKQPYSALFERLKHFLLTPDTLLMATGFSFRDAHICAVLDEALEMNKNTAVFAFQFQRLAQEGPVCELARNRPNLSVYASDGAVINGIPGNWRPGEMPKNWEDIQASFWGRRGNDDPKSFLLGDFAHFSRFCALAQATDVSNVSQAAAQPQTSALQTQLVDSPVAEGA